MKSLRKATLHKGVKAVQNVIINLPHKIRIGMKGYRQCSVSYCLLVALFGQHFSLVQTELIVKEIGKKTGIFVHLHSSKSAIELLKLSDLCGARFESGNVEETFTMAPRVLLLDPNKKRIVGYSMSEEKQENEHFVFIHVPDSKTSFKILKFRIPAWNGKSYDLEGCQQQEDGYSILEYEPICIYASFKSRCNFRICFARVCIDSNGKIVLHKSTN